MQVQSESIQSALLHQIKLKLGANTSLADEVAELLHISRDSAYRRMRGDTILSLDEAKSLCNHFNISIDQLFTGTHDQVSFHRTVVDFEENNLGKWINNILKNLEYIGSFANSEMIFCAKDIPAFQYFRQPDIASFKLFFWLKTLIGYPEYQHLKYQLESVPKEMLIASAKIWDTYASLVSTEIWNEQSIYCTLRQIEFYHQCDFFSTPEQAGYLCDQLYLVVDQVQAEAAMGKKSNHGTFNLYNNEILIADNTVFARVDSRRCVYVNQNTLTILRTFQEPFCEQTEAYLLNLIEKSVLISKTGERERNRFFNVMKQRIQTFKASLK